MSERGWIGVDLDGTLAHYDGWKGIEHIGKPIPAMLERVWEWTKRGQEVRIFTARASDKDAINYITKWLIRHRILDHHGQPLAVTNVKDFAMIELWDDRAVQVEANTGLAYVHPHGKPTP